MNTRQRRTLQEIFENPLRSNIPLADIESLIRACGANVSEGKGSRVRFELDGVKAVFHRPHPQSETDKGTFKSMRRFWTEAGVTP